MESASVGTWPPDDHKHRAYAGGYLFGQHISLDDGQDVGSQSAIGLISELGFQVKTRWGATIDVGPVVTIPVYAQAVYPDGDIETTDFPLHPHHQYVENRCWFLLVVST